MANILSWGKPKIEICKLENGDYPSPPVWKVLPTPVENSTKLDTQEGDSKEAKLEGGEVLATRKGASKYKFEFELYETDDFTAPIEDNDGIVLDLYAVRLTPENTAAKGLLFDRCSVSVVKTWDSETGAKIKYTFDGLKPQTGKILKEYNR